MLTQHRRQPGAQRSSLEELNKKLGSELAVSEATVALLGGSAGLEDRGELAIRGREQGLRVYAVGASPARVESAQKF